MPTDQPTHMGVQKYTAGSGRETTEKLQISLRQSGGIDINAAGMDEWFADADAVVYTSMKMRDKLASNLWERMGLAQTH